MNEEEAKRSVHPGIEAWHKAVRARHERTSDYPEDAAEIAAETFRQTGGYPLDINSENADWLRSPVQGYDTVRKRAEQDARGLDGFRLTDDTDQSGASTLDSKEAKNGEAEESV